MANHQTEFTVAAADWIRDRDELLSVREQVFVVEQGVTREIEIDGKDGDCEHVLAQDMTGRPIGTARLDRLGHIGRVAVVKEWRGRGVGRMIMVKILDRALATGLAQVELNSQTHAAEFYRALHFEPEGEEFEEAGIPHVRMVRTLPSST